ncbi:hypothetical protein [Rhizobium mongolense]|uniref:Uncharacterized protein n=1 Tax=Rhizobium mongolense TaxID=57676 RepID=A0ABR6J189_9HYPH|nr:hypothetical protein [Rhizobium mongolense]MBB4233434.1 hypothetical protein [Rhizobium mongolense]
MGARRALLAKGRQEGNTRAIVGTAVAQRQLVDAATKKRAAVRRGGAGKPKTNADDRGWGSLRGIDFSKPVPFVEDTGRAAMNNEISHLTASAAALLAEQPGLRGRNRAPSADAMRAETPSS